MILKIFKYLLYLGFGIFAFFFLIGVFIGDDSKVYDNIKVYQEQYEKDNQEFELLMQKLNQSDLNKDKHLELVDEFLFKLELYNNHLNAYKQFLEANSDTIVFENGSVTEELMAIQDEIASIEFAKKEITDAKTISNTPSSRYNDKGDFKVIYSPITKRDYLQYETWFKESKLFDEAAAGLNQDFNLPFDITINVTECSEENAVYNPNTKQIVVCYELIHRFNLLYSEYYSKHDESGEQLTRDILSSTFFTFYHEVGHALIDAYDLPVTGREEDAADQLSVLILSLVGDDGEDLVLRAAEGFGLMGEQIEELEDMTFWDEHPLDQQRLSNFACWIYGKNPNGHKNLITDKSILLYLPKERAIRCQSEYSQIYTSWNTLLTPYAKINNP